LESQADKKKDQQLSQLAPCLKYMISMIWSQESVKGVEGAVQVSRHIVLATHHGKVHHDDLTNWPILDGLGQGADLAR
jgi:hypothetical protein